MNNRLAPPVNAAELGFPTLQAATTAVLAKIFGLEPSRIELIDRERGENCLIHVDRLISGDLKRELILGLAFELVDHAVSGEAPTLVNLDATANPWLSCLLQKAKALADRADARGAERSWRTQITKALAAGDQLLEYHQDAVEDIARHLLIADLDEADLKAVLEAHAVAPLSDSELTALGLRPAGTIRFEELVDDFDQ